MCTPSINKQQVSFFGEDLLNQLDQQYPLLKLAEVIPWQELEDEFQKYYSHKGASSKPIRLMVGLLLLKQLENLSDERVVEQFKCNPYYQVFCGLTNFSLEEPCHSTELVYCLESKAMDTCFFVPYVFTVQ